MKNFVIFILLLVCFPQIISIVLGAIVSVICVAGFAPTLIIIFLAFLATR